MELPASTCDKRNKWHSKKKLIESPREESFESTDVSSGSSQNPAMEYSSSPDEFSVPKTDTLIQEETQDFDETAKELAEDIDIYSNQPINYSTEDPSASYYFTVPVSDLNEPQEYSTDIRKIQFKEPMQAPARVTPSQGYEPQQKLNHNLKNSFEEYKLQGPLYAEDGRSNTTGTYGPKYPIKTPEPKETSKYSMADLKKNPELFKKAYEEALRLEREQGRDYTYVINFFIQYNTQFGDKILVTGGHEMLGNWDPAKGLELEWNPGNIWNSTIHVGEGQLFDLEYKYVCLQGTGVVIWEGGFNRKLKVKEGKPKGEKLIFEMNEIWQR